MEGYHYVYILQSVSHPEQHYTGQTQHLKQRLDEHNGLCRGLSAWSRPSEKKTGRTPLSVTSRPDPAERSFVATFDCEMSADARENLQVRYGWQAVSVIGCKPAIAVALAKAAEV
jgi:hypothetical protein